MSCYCGCATKENKVKWAVFAVFCALAIIFFALYEDHSLHVATEYQQCMEPYSDLPIDSIIREEADQECKNIFKQHVYNQVAPFGLLFIICAVASSIPLYIMCCCTKKPEQVPEYVVATPATAAVAYQKL
eukprot:TRINITY_DN862_c0_g1_i8.p1 TRINITY_DN862_c0_g1~~TRINITY_DN862_c0_g1_i8.p1  ORF type:complete len:130 (-),score=22.35 TRINITY_DN862_c0_g1_i8:62-451(-)